MGTDFRIVRLCLCEQPRPPGSACVAKPTMHMAIVGRKTGGRNFGVYRRVVIFPVRQVGRRNFSPMAWYNKKIEKSPIITKGITSGG